MKTQLSKFNCLKFVKSHVEISHLPHLHAYATFRNIPEVDEEYMSKLLDKLYSLGYVDSTLCKILNLFDNATVKYTERTSYGTLTSEDSLWHYIDCRVRDGSKNWV